MGQYTLWKVGYNNYPEQIHIDYSANLHQMIQYLNGLRHHNPKKAYWICDRHTGEMLPY